MLRCVLERLVRRAPRPRELLRGASPAARRRRAAPLIFAANLVALFVACGGGDAAPAGPGSDAGTTCTPRLPAAWAPHWTPPRAPRSDACSEDQIQLEYRACESLMGTAASCAPFRDDPSNATCVGCLFSDGNESSYGAIIRLDDSWKTNTPGCIALLDGDKSSSGCGAKVQAASACYDAACEGCEPFTSYTKCREEAGSGPCRQYYLDAVCLLRPLYSRCTAYATNQDYFVAAARLFCGVVTGESGGRARGGNE